MAVVNTQLKLGFPFVSAIDRPLAALGSTVQYQPMATRTFYLTGTTTLAPVYWDAALTAPMTQSPTPITADITGRFPPIYLSPNIQYRCQLRNAAGTLLSDTDPINVPTRSFKNSQLLGVPQYAFKRDNTSRNQTPATLNILVPTYFNDPELQIAVPAAGFYRVEVDLVFQSGNTSGLSADFSVNWSGTQPNPGTNKNALSMVGNTSATSLSAANSFAALQTPGTVFNNTGNIGTNGFSIIRISGVVQVTSPGAFTIGWAPHASNNVSISLLAGSSMSVTQLG